MLRGEHLIIETLSFVAGSAADRSTFVLLNGIVGDGPHAHSTSTSRRAGRDDRRFIKNKMDLKKEGGPRMLRGGLPNIHPLPIVAGSAADRSTVFLLNGVVGDGPRAHSTRGGWRRLSQLYLSFISIVPRLYFSCAVALSPC